MARRRSRPRPPATPRARQAPPPRRASPCRPVRRTRSEGDSAAVGPRRRFPRGPSTRAAPARIRARTDPRSAGRSARSRALACVPPGAGSTRGRAPCRSSRRARGSDRGRTATCCNDRAMATGATERAARPNPGTELLLQIDSLAQGGRGVARADGYVVFVSGALPGDTVRARLSKAKRGYGEASALEIVEPSPNRIPDRCTHDGEPCPGAPWQGLPYEAQLAEKTRQVDEALRRLGGLEGFELEPIVPSAQQWRYRNKLEYSFGERDGELILGYHRRGSWSQVVNAEDCQLATEQNNQARNETREWTRRDGIPAYDPDAHAGVLRNLVVREGRRTGQIQTRLVTSPARFPRPPVDLHTVVEGTGSGTSGPTGVLGEEFLEERL